MLSLENGSPGIANNWWSESVQIGESWAAFIGNKCICILTQIQQTNIKLITILLIFGFNTTKAQNSDNRNLTSYIELPIFNTFYATHNAGNKINYNGFGGLEFGLKLLSKKNYFVSSSIGFRTTDIGKNSNKIDPKEGSKIIFGFINLNNNHIITKLEFGYGISFNNFAFSKSYYNSSNQFISESGDGLLAGFNARIGYNLYDKFSIGLNFQNGFIDLSRNNDIKNFHAFTFSIRYLVYKKKRAKK